MSALINVLHLTDPETAHRLTIAGLKLGVLPSTRDPDARSLAVSALGLNFSNPIGLAAGFDKNAEVPDAMLRLGFGFVEVGTITPQPQNGNAKPRIFRLPEDRAVINRLGFNNEGLAAARRRLERRKGRIGVVGINIGANRDTPDRTSDYLIGFEAFAPLASYITINVSSPNTPGLRGLQDRKPLDDLLRRLIETRAKKPVATPILLKVAPDLDDKAREDVAEIALMRRLDGIIVSNTTLSRPSALKNPQRSEEGGLSGAPLFQLSTTVLRDFYRLTQNRLLLVGVGGIASGADAYAKIRAGATLVQLYTALAYQGPGLIWRIKRDLAQLLERDGFKSVGEAVGADIG